MAQIVPLTSSPNQTLNVSLNVDGGVLRLTLVIAFSEIAQYWTMSIADATGNQILSSIPMLTGSYPAANILQQYGYLQIGSAFLVNNGHPQFDYPMADQLGNDFILLWDDTAP